MPQSRSFFDYPHGRMHSVGPIGAEGLMKVAVVATPSPGVETIHRFRMDADDAEALARTILDIVAAHRSTIAVQSARSPGRPSSAVSTPDAGV